MKILTGRFKHTEIPFKPQPGLRPTSDRVRKAIMDSLMGGWEGASVLDLYSGTGALGLEAVSAGAAGAVFVESDRRRADAIEGVVEKLGISDNCRVERSDVLSALESLKKRGAAFDRVFADPPYEKGLAIKTLEFFSDGSALKPGAWITIETYKKEPLPDVVGRLQRRRNTAYGDTAVHYYVLV
jgi:16S rRNA (guanine966-N2)-methyltransferase